MRNLLAVCLMFLGVVVQAQFLPERIAQLEQREVYDKHKADRSAVNNNNIIYARLELAVDPAVNYISGKVTSVFIPNGHISYIQFDLNDSLQVDSVKYHGAPASFMRQTGAILHIDLPDTIAGLVADSISVYYSGVPTKSGMGSFTQAKHGPDSIPIIWTLSEPYGARDWWPCKQNLGDKIDSIDIIVTVPQGNRVASNGLLVSETGNGNKVTFYWKHRFPIAAYLVAIAVTNYEVYSDYAYLPGGMVEVLNYVYPETLEKSKQETIQVIPDIKLFDSLFGQYPFSREKYGHAQFGWGGGMEHQTMSFMGGFDFELVAHELAHQWFGDKVTCASWQDIWLNEGFASYCTGLCYQYVNPAWWGAFKKTRLNHVTSKPDGSVYCYDTTNVSRIFDGRLSYSKGAMVLHQLRWVLGDEKFFEGIRRYLNDVSHAYGFATTANFKTQMEAVSDKDLTHYFDAWIYAQGFPSYQVTWWQDFDRHVQVKLTQTQSHNSVPFFTMPVPVLIKNATRDTLIVLNNTSSGQTFDFDLPFLADTLIFDPEQWLISANNTISRVGSYTFSLYPYPNPVIDALHMRVEAVASQFANIYVYSSAGQLMYTQVYHAPAGSSDVIINTQGWATGVYRLKVETADKIITSSFVKGNP